MQADSNTSMKTCSHCKRVHPVEKFGRNKAARDGLQYWCKDCQRAGFRTWLEKNRSTFNDYMQKRYHRLTETASDGSLQTYYQRHRAKILAQRKESYRANRDKPVEQRTRRVYRSRYDPEKARQSYQRNRDRILAREKERYALDPSKAIGRAKSRLHRMRAAEGNFTPAEWAALCEKYGNRCLCCGATGIILTVDHVIPLSKGGTNWPSNLQPLCKSCNSRKHARTIDYRPPEQLSLL